MEQMQNFIIAIKMKSSGETTTIEYYSFSLTKGTVSQGEKSLDSFKIEFDFTKTVLINSDYNTQKAFSEYFFLKHSGNFPESISTFKILLQKSDVSNQTMIINNISPKMGEIITLSEEGTGLFFTNQFGQKSKNLLKTSGRIHSPSGNYLLVTDYPKASELYQTHSPKIEANSFLWILSPHEMNLFNTVWLPFKDEIWTKPAEYVSEILTKISYLTLIKIKERLPEWKNLSDLEFIDHLKLPVLNEYTISEAGFVLPQEEKESKNKGVQTYHLSKLDYNSAVLNYLWVTPEETQFGISDVQKFVTYITDKPVEKSKIKSRLYSMTTFNLIETVSSNIWKKPKHFEDLYDNYKRNYLEK